MHSTPSEAITTVRVSAVVLPWRAAWSCPPPHSGAEALQLEVRQVRHSWAGLRNFVADRAPVIGFAADAEGFFWLAGQGGHGIQTAPAAARLAADLLLHNGVPTDLEQAGFDPAWVSPRRIQAGEGSPTGPITHFNTSR